MNSVTAIILGGGRGARLYPLTLKRAKPAVGFAGKYRIIDIPVSNCINSGIKRIFVLTQFLSASLHRHIMRTYRFDEFTGGFVDILAAEQTALQSDWFQGPADAVRATLNHTMYYKSEEMIILSGDQLYRMDYSDLIRTHRRSQADITICVCPVDRKEARRMGLVVMDSRRRVQQFVEKPEEDETIDAFRIKPGVFKAAVQAGEEAFLGSMGLYVFRPEVLARVLEGNSAVDFGMGIFQSAIDRYRVTAYPFSGYWRDIGTIEAFFEANSALARPEPPFTLHAPRWPLYTHARSLPPSRMVGSRIRDSLIAEGAFVSYAHIADSVIGVRSVIGRGSLLRKVVLFGADFYEGERQLEARGADNEGAPPMGIGRGCSIECAIIDKNVRIGDNVKIREKKKGEEFHGEWYWVRDGVTVIPKGTVIPPGTEI